MNRMRVVTVSIFLIATLLGTGERSFAQDADTTEADAPLAAELVQMEPPAEESEESELAEEDEADITGVTPFVVGKLEQTHATLSGRIETMAKSIDEFFAEDKVFEEATKSYARVRLDTVFREYGDNGFAGDLKLRVDLPRTKERFRLLIETDPQRDTTEKLEDVPADVVEEKSYFLSIERQLRESGKWDIRPALGIKLHLPPDPFARLRAFRYIGLDKWLLRLSGNAFWFDSNGWGGNTSMEFDRPLSDEILFRATSVLSWQEQEKFRRFDQAFSLFQRIDHRRSLVYEIGALTDDAESWDANTYFMQIRYRKDVHKGWLFAEVVPRNTFLETAGFHPEPSFTLRLEMVFGKGYL